MATKTTQPDWYLPPEGEWEWRCDRDVERTTVHRHFLRGPSGAIGSTTTRTRIPEVSEPGPPCACCCCWWRGCPDPRGRGRAAGPGRRRGPPGPAGGSPPGRAGAVSGPARRAGAEEGAGRRPAVHPRNTVGCRLKNGGSYFWEEKKSDIFFSHSMGKKLEDSSQIYLFVYFKCFTDNVFFWGGGGGNGK